MGRRGPPPKPARLKELAGNPGKRPLKSSPNPGGRRPSCPAWLPEGGRSEWRRLAPELERLGFLTALDRAAFAAYCAAYAHWRESVQAIEEQGPVYLTAGGRLLERPHVTVARQCGRMMREFAVEFGLTPSSRARLSFPEGPEDDEFERFLQG